MRGRRSCAKVTCHHARSGGGGLHARPVTPGCGRAGRRERICGDEQRRDVERVIVELEARAACAVGVGARRDAQPRRRPSCSRQEPGSGPQSCEVDLPSAPVDRRASPPYSAARAARSASSQLVHRPCRRSRTSSCVTNSRDAHGLVLGVLPRRRSRARCAPYSSIMCWQPSQVPSVGTPVLAAVRSARRARLRGCGTGCRARTRWRRPAWQRPRRWRIQLRTRSVDVRATAAGCSMRGVGGDVRREVRRSRSPTILMRALVMARPACPSVAGRPSNARSRRAAHERSLI